MKKGFIATLVASTIALAGSSFAIAPTILNLPDITIGDREDNIGTDNNFFVYTNAFSFDEKVVDPDTTFTDLKWSFDEFDANDGSETDVQWFTVNGKAPIHKKSADIVAEQTAGPAAHLTPGSANELRSVSPFATFRDIVLTPGNGPLTSAFAPQASAVVTRHGNGKYVRFYVSDTFQVATKDCFVKTVDNAFDAISGGSQFTPKVTDDFATDPTPPSSENPPVHGWSSFTMNTAGFANATYDASAASFKGTAGALRANVAADATRYRSSGWVSNLSEWMQYADVSNDKYVRVKFYMYAGGQSTSAANVIPNMRLRASTRYAVNSMIEVLHHDNADVAAQPYATDFRPSTNPALPSLYRVDFDPVDVPYLVSNGTINVGTGAGEGIGRAFEAYTLNPQDNGYIAMTESIIGTYPASALADSAALPSNSKTYAVSGSDAGDLKVFNSATDVQNYNMKMGTVEGGYASLDTTSAKGTYTEAATGVNMDTSAVPAYPIVGIILREFDPDGNTANYASRVRIAPNQQYKVRWHITSTGAAATNSQIRLRARACKFQWTQKYEIGGAYAAGGASNTIARQALPGTGCLNPDKNSGDTTGGWYTMLVQSPLNADIRAEQPGQPLSVTMPNISGQPGPGAASASQFRDLRLGCEVVDSISWNDTNEHGSFRIDRIEVKSYNLVDDGGY